VVYQKKRKQKGTESSLKIGREGGGIERGGVSVVRKSTRWARGIGNQRQLRKKVGGERKEKRSANASFNRLGGGGLSNQKLR